MAEPFFPLTALSEAQRAQALERFTIIRPALEEGVSQAQVARTSKKAPYGPALDQALSREGLGWASKQRRALR